MSTYLVLVENDESQWNDQKGVTYHFPNKYKRLILPGVEFVYYKGRMVDPGYRHLRVSRNEKPHYFGKGVIGEVVQDINNRKNYFATIEEYYEFEEAIDFKEDGTYLETAAYDRKNYFRDGVREITAEVYKKIISTTKMNLVQEEGLAYNVSHEKDFESREEGHKKKRYTSYYERNPINRQKAIEFHGFRCVVCKLNFEETYGELGKGFIHIHHVKPISTRDTAYFPDIENDFAALCPNCHAMVHRPKDRTLTVEELKKIYEESKG